MGILGYRHSSYGLVDMRIHDISVVADLSRRHPYYPDEPPPSEDPEDGMDYDGTVPLTSQDDSVVTAKMDYVATLADAYWELVNYWPRLFLEVLAIFDDLVESTFLLSTDFFGDFLTHTLSFESQAVDAKTDQELETDAEAMDDYFTEFFVNYASYAILGASIGFALTAIELIANPVAISTNLGTFLVMLGAWCALFTAYLAALQWAVRNEVMHPWSAAASMIGLLFMLFPKLIRSLINANRLLGLCWRFRDAGWGGNANIRKGIWYAAVSLVKVIAVIVAGYFLFYFYTLGVVMGGGQ